MSLSADFFALLASAAAILLGIWSHYKLNMPLQSLYKLSLSFFEQSQSLAREVTWASERESNRSSSLYYRNYIRAFLKPESFKAGLITSKDKTNLTPAGEQILEELGITNIVNAIYSQNRQATPNDVIWELLSGSESQNKLYYYNQTIADPKKRISLKAILGAAAGKLENIKKS